MATAYKPPQGGKGADEEAVRVHRIRITLTSKNVVNLEKGERRRARSGCDDTLSTSTSVLGLVLWNSFGGDGSLRVADPALRSPQYAR